MDNCKICMNTFELSPDNLVLCEHKEGFVHFGCCIDRCSGNRAPCVHCKSIYAKEEKK